MTRLIARTMMLLATITLVLLLAIMPAAGQETLVEQSRTQISVDISPPFGAIALTYTDECGSIWVAEYDRLSYAPSQGGVTGAGSWVTVLSAADTATYGHPGGPSRTLTVSRAPTCEYVIVYRNLAAVSHIKRIEYKSGTAVVTTVITNNLYTPGCAIDTNGQLSDIRSNQMLYRSLLTLLCAHALSRRSVVLL